jgi:flagellar export protein FliJ
MNGQRLAAVLRVRELQERGARGELARNNEQLRRAASAERRTWTSLDRPPPDATLSAQQIAAHSAFRAAGTLAADSQRAVTESAAEGVVLARDSWTVAARRVEALERLDERQRTEAAVEFERQRSNDLDDMVLARRGRNAGSGVS